jgi:DNA-binding transcriptional LysR family regulator
MDRLLVMRSLVAVADTESFVTAADQVSTSASSVSRHVADLEKQLGARLVNRTARSVTLTEHGIRYAAFARRILDEIEQEDQAFTDLDSAVSGSLSVVCPKWLGMLDLGDAVAAFAVAHPQVEVRLHLGGVSDRAHAFLESGFDVSFHSRPLRDSQMRLRRIATLPFVVCAAPSYLDARGRPTTVAELGVHDCLAHDHESSWQLEVDGVRQLHRFSRQAFRANSYVALEKAATQGRGVAMLPLRLVRDALEAGTLEAMFGGAAVQERSLAAVYSAGSKAPRKVVALLDFVVEWYADQATGMVTRG